MKGDKGGGEEGRSGGRVNRAWRGEMRKKGREEMGPKAHSKKSDFVVPLWFRCSLVAVAFQLLTESSIYTTNLYDDTAPIWVAMLHQKH